MNRSLILLGGLLALAGCTGTAVPGNPGAGDDWPYRGGDVWGSHHSWLTDIDKGNVPRLGLAWSYDLGTNRVQEATPIEIGGILYASGNLGRAYALDATTGKPVWTFEPEVDMQANRAACCDQANRGLAVGSGKVMVGALDGKLYALDGKTGKIVWKVDTVADHGRGYTITGAPEIAGDLVIIGNAGAEYDTRGYVTAYRIADGTQAWRFYTVPHDPALGPQENPALEAALKTWDAKSRWDIGGGGTVWDAINYDPKFDTVYIGVGNGGPYSIATRSPKGGSNLYLSSIVALDAKSGVMKWHYQETPGDSWDYTATQPMVLTEMEVDGKVRPVIIHAPKNGYLFVLDRETGKPLRINALVRTNWAKDFDAAGAPRLTPEHTDFWNGPRIVFPASPGARNWYPAAWDPTRKLYYAAVLDMGNLMYTVPPGSPARPRRPKALNIQTTLVFSPQLQTVLPSLPPAIRGQVEKLPEMKWVKDKPYSSELRAIDPLTGKARWTVAGEGWQDRMGVLSTASGLVFHGSIGGKLMVRDADNGRLLEEIDTGSSIMAAPMTYRVKGVQYVAVATGFGGGGWSYVPQYAAAYRYGNANRILVFKLDGGPVQKPALLPPLEVAAAPPPQKAGVTPTMIAQGRGLFFENCAMCHSNQLRSTAPDLRRMQPGVHNAFGAIVRDGLLLPGGMPRWDDLLSARDVDAIHAWLIDEQEKVRARELKLKAQGKPLDAPSAAIMSNF